VAELISGQRGIIRRRWGWDSYGQNIEGHGLKAQRSCARRLEEYVEGERMEARGEAPAKKKWSWDVCLNGLVIMIAGIWIWILGSWKPKLWFEMWWRFRPARKHKVKKNPAKVKQS
jgi:hypothetical protein